MAAAAAPQPASEDPLFLHDVSNSQAYAVLDQCVRDGKITGSEAVMYKSQFAQIHERLLLTYEHEKALIRKAKQLRQDDMNEKLKMEQLEQSRMELRQENERFEKEREKVLKEVHDCEVRDYRLGYELQEMQQRKADMQRQLAHMHQENESLVQPQLTRVRNQIYSYQEDLQRCETARAAEEESKQSIERKLELLAESIDVMEEEHAAEQRNYSRITSDPDRIKKQSAVVLKATDTLVQESERVEARMNEVDGELAHQHKSFRAKEEAMFAARRGVDESETATAKQSQGCEELHKAVAGAQLREQELRTCAVELDLAERGVESELRQAMDTFATESKMFERLKRQLRKFTKQSDAAQNVLPEFTSILADTQSSLASYRAENKQLRQVLATAKQEVRVFYMSTVRASKMSEEQEEQLAKLRSETEHLEHMLEQWRQETHRMSKTIGLLTAQRELKAREAARAGKSEVETREDIKIKELVILDLGKKRLETEVRLKEFAALYDVVKNERNKYVNLIQASSQALAEMKEKVKILYNEVDILRNESRAKDRALNKERISHQTAQYQRDQLRADHNKLNEIYRLRQDKVETQIVQIDKLNSVINAMEQEMLKLKREYEAAVEARNFAGVQLIDRNDELCILYEKANINEETMKRGLLALNEKDDAVKVLSSLIGELERQIEVVRRQHPRMQELAETILELRQALSEERQVTQKLCAELEDPQNLSRWRYLDGDDLEESELTAKLHVLESMVDRKKEVLLEKELVLEEVGALSSKLRDLACSGREGTVELAKRVNAFQVRIKDVTKKMMAAVSELSMYQATAMKLQQEKRERELELEQATSQFEQGLAPTEEIERDWYRMERQHLLRQELQLRASASRTMAPDPVRTTAVPRPNAYIPDDIGIPKPYGQLAPFKPVEPGSIMRHYRKPEPQEIKL